MVHGVEGPPKDEVLGALATIPLEELLQRDGLILMWFVSSRLGQHRIDGMEEVVVQGFELLGPPCPIWMKSSTKTSVELTGS